MISSADFTVSLLGAVGALAPQPHPRRGLNRGTRRGRRNRVGQISWPPAGSFHVRHRAASWPSPGSLSCPLSFHCSGPTCGIRCEMRRPRWVSRRGRNTSVDTGRPWDRRGQEAEPTSVLSTSTSLFGGQENDIQGTRRTVSAALGLALAVSLFGGVNAA